MMSEPDDKREFQAGPDARVVSRSGAVYLLVAVLSVPLGILAGALADELGYIFLMAGWAVPLSTLSVSAPLTDLISWRPAERLTEALLLLPLAFWIARGPLLLWLGRRERTRAEQFPRAPMVVFTIVVIIACIGAIGALIAYAREGYDDPAAWLLATIVALGEITFAFFATYSLRARGR